MHKSTRMLAAATAAFISFASASASAFDNRFQIDEKVQQFIPDPGTPTGAVCAINTQPPSSPMQTGGVPGSTAVDCVVNCINGETSELPNNINGCIYAGQFSSSDRAAANWDLIEDTMNCHACCGADCNTFTYCAGEDTTPFQSLCPNGCP